MSFFFYALVVFIGVGTHWGPLPQQSTADCQGRRISMVKSWTLCLFGRCVLLGVSAWLVFYLAWSTYPGGMRDNKCEINELITN
jgi:hypothetical protein